MGPFSSSDNIDLASTDLFVPPKSDLSVSKIVNNATPPAGSNIIYTITATNNGSGVESAAVINDLLPAGVTYVSHSTANGTYIPSTGVWTIGSIPVNGTRVLTITARVEALGSIVNTATISGNNIDVTTTNNSSSVTINPISPTGDLGITKISNISNPTIGTAFTYTITATNNSIVGISGVQVNDVLDSRLTFLGNGTSQGSYNETTGVWNVGYLAPGASATLTITVSGNTAAIISNTATITGLLNDTFPANNSASISVTTTGVGTDLSITKTANNGGLVSLDGQVTFTLTASNQGTIADTNVYVVDKLPNGYTSISGIPSIGTYNTTYGLWTIGNLAVGASATLTITATAPSTNATTNQGYLTNNVVIYGTQNDFNLTNNSASAIVNFNTDTDGDGILDYLDLDDDNDGILDSVEMAACTWPSPIPAGVKRYEKYKQDFGVMVTPAAGTPTNGGTNGIRPVGLSGQEGTSQFLYKKTNATGDGFYSLTPNPNFVDDFGAPYDDQWLHLNDHTYNVVSTTRTGNGLMLAINPTDTTKYIWQSPSINVSPGAAIEVGLWLLNLKAAIAGPTYADPNLTISVYDTATDTFLGSGTTGQFTKTGTWQTNSQVIIPSILTSRIYIRITNAQGASNGNDFAIDDIIVNEIYCDNDGDGIPNHLDPDSDNDGCYDSIEGTGNVLPNQLNNNGSINNTANGGIDTNGIPNLVNPGGSADTDSKVGQAAGSAYNNTIKETLTLSSTSPSSQTVCVNGTLAPLEVTATVANGTTPTSFQWYSNTTNSTTGGTLLIGETNNTIVLPSTTAGTYYYYVLATGGCNTTASNVFQAIISPLPTITGTNSVCESNTTQLTGSGTAAASNPWTSSNILVATVSSTGLVSGLSAGTTNITYTNSGGCTNMITITVTQCVCYNPATNTTSGTDTLHGITLLKRAGADNGNWPMLRKSAHTALESNTKGFVITRVANPVTAISNPIEGMIVYDTTAKCLKVYSDGIWSCFSTPACP